MPLFKSKTDWRMKYSAVWCKRMGTIPAGAANLNGLKVLSHDDYAMGSGRKLIYLALVRLICDCVQAFTGFMVGCSACLSFFLWFSTFVSCFVLVPCCIEVAYLPGVLLYVALQQTA
jgi:hypothetical protein